MVFYGKDLRLRDRGGWGGGDMGKYIGDYCGIVDGRGTGDLVIII